MQQTAPAETPRTFSRIADAPATPSSAKTRARSPQASSSSSSAAASASGRRAPASASLSRSARRGGGLDRKRVIQRRFNVSVPRARVPVKASTLRDRSER